MSRFSQYKRGDLPPLRKLDVGGEFTDRLLGVREWESKDGPVAVLDFEDDDGNRFSWMASTWHAAEQLELADPQDGDLVRVRRLPDKGMSYQWEIRVVGQQQLGQAGTAAPDDDVPFKPSVL